ncbi:hypothetical protein D3C78_1081840 [compost metagenome]
MLWYKALIQMNFSSPHGCVTACTLHSLIQETTVCPPSRGLFFCLRIRNSRLTEGFLEQHKNRPPFEMRVLRFNTNSIRSLDLSRRHRLLRFGEHGLFQPRSPVERQRRQ